MPGSGGADDPDEVLPDGWKKWYSERRKRYYYNHEATGKVQWTSPNADAKPGAASPKPKPAAATKPKAKPAAAATPAPAPAAAAAAAAAQAP
eukprot:CAMPEP_0182562094 /NCGR_PEP_ID=MMETSP1324-20130603/4474_1 /TAXON_ID=236786 /ORGANISM="Florenciella sp., Strain RCC1587" /LENGTH=91 /DNA_ID=CAMNT_0024774917 /DNA_START=355 /DNA_END=626 /DNA_ORIENTATION=-